jgi:histidine triad (HIT) family protein
MSDCVFCNHDNINGIELLVDNIYMFTPLNPVVPGHKCFIHKEHTANASSDPNIYAEVSKVAALYAGLQGVPFNLITSAGEEATQSVRHLHVHYVPRAEADGLYLPWTNQVKGGKPMTNYNERLDEILDNHAQEFKAGHLGKVKQAITSLIKELVTEARLDELKHLTDDDGIWYQDMARQFPQKITLNQRIKELE